MELGLSNYGPTPTPYYTDAEIIAVRSAQELVSEIENLAEDQRAELVRLLSTTSTTELGAADPRENALRAANLVRLRAKAVFMGVL